MPSTEDLSSADVESTSQLLLLLFSEGRDFFGCGESEGVRERFSPRDKMLLSVSAADVAELDMRREL